MVRRKLEDLLTGTALAVMAMLAVMAAAAMPAAAAGVTGVTAVTTPAAAGAAAVGTGVAATATAPSSGYGSVPANPATILAPVQTVQVYDTDYPFINYSGTPVHNDIARLQQRLNSGEVKLKFDAAHPDRGYLDSLLAALGIDRSSQVLVFSKTSLQIDAISPQTPRAIYFNDDTYIAWLQGTGLLEIVTMDADRGPVFYMLHNHDRSAVRLQRETLRCLTCHDSFSEMGGGVPYFLFESTYQVQGRDVLPDVVARDTSDQTPIAQRWGGWYVTGDDGGAFHLGNILSSSTDPEAAHSLAYRGSVKSLSTLFDTSPYLTDKSDIVALLVLEHQVTIHNLMIHANYKSRVLLTRDLPAAQASTVHWDQLPGKIQTRLAAMVEPLVRGMLLVDAAPLTRKVVGNSGYSAQFQARGPRDPQGRSLRDLDLNTRVFRYPMSFLIYTESFDALPDCVREHLYRRFVDILSGRDRSEPYAHLAAADRQAVMEILKATKPEFAQALAHSGGT